MVDKLIFWLPFIVSVLYLVTCVAFISRREYHWALTYFAYALANVGLIWGTTFP